LASSLISERVAAQTYANHRITQSDIDGLESGLSERLEELLNQRGSHQEQVPRILNFLEREELPIKITKYLTIQAAKIEGNSAKKVALLESILDDSAPQEDADIRWAIMNNFQGREGFGSYVERIERMDLLMEPLLAIPSEKYSTQSIDTLASYANLVREFGVDLTTEKRRPGLSESERIDAEIDIAKAQIMYAEKASRILVELSGVVNRRIENRDPSKVKPPDHFGRVDDPLLNAQAMLKHNLRRANELYERMNKHLVEYQAKMTALQESENLK
jgi:hypothetical protein